MALSPAPQRALRVLKNLDDFQVWPVKHRHWEFEVVESESHEIWVNTTDLRLLYDALPPDKVLKEVYFRSMLYAKNTRAHYLSERSMRMELRKSARHPRGTDVLKFLEWFDRNVMQVAAKKRENTRLDDGNAYREQETQKISIGPVPGSLAPLQLDAATVPFTAEERWAMEQESEDIRRVYRHELRPVPTTWKAWARDHATAALDYLASFWRGERNLFLTFFVGVLCLKLPGAFLSTLVPEALDWTVSHRRVMWAFALVVPLALVCAVVYTVAITRSTYNAWKQPGGKLWATTFYLLVIAAGPLAFFANYDDEMLEYWWAGVRNKYDPITAYADPHLGRIVVRGPMEFGSAEALQTILDKHPKFTLVQIESPGGFVIEGMRMARMLEQRKMDTVSLEGCASACTFLLAAGVERYLGPEVRVGFHRSGTRYGPVGDGWNETDHKIADYYRRRGTQEAFVQKALTPSIRQIWVAPHADMFASGYATLRWSERKPGY